MDRLISTYMYTFSDLCLKLYCCLILSELFQIQMRISFSFLGAKCLPTSLLIMRTRTFLPSFT